MVSPADNMCPANAMAIVQQSVDRNARARILYLAEALDRRTHQPGQHGGVLKRSGLAVLRALLFGFLNAVTSLTFGGLVLLTANWVAGLAHLLFWTYLWRRTPLEEAKLIERFGDVYRAFLARTGGLLHRL